MEGKFRRSLLGYKPEEVKSRIEKIENDHQKEIALLEAQIEEVKTELRKAEEQQARLEAEVKEYTEKEKVISEIMLKAQLNARKIEEEARERAHIMIQEAENELKEKLRELEALRVKVKNFKQDFRETLDNYRLSLESIKEDPEGASFMPTLVAKNKQKDMNKM